MSDLIDLLDLPDLTLPPGSSGVLGVPGVGFHTHTLGGVGLGFAYLDVLATIALGVVIAKLVGGPSLPSGWSTAYAVLALFGAATFLHTLFKVK